MKIAMEKKQNTASLNDDGYDDFQMPERKVVERDEDGEYEYTKNQSNQQILANNK